MVELLPGILVGGSISALVALAYHLVFRATGGVMDFAIGQYVVLGGIASAFLVSEMGLSAIIAVPLGIAISIAASLLSELLVLRRLSRLSHGQATVGAVIATVALLWIWEQITRLTFGDTPRRSEEFFAGVRLELGGALWSGHAMLTVIVALLIFGALAVGLAHSPQGRWLRAVGDNGRAAELLGLPATRTRLIAFLVAGFITGVVGVFGMPLAGFRPLGGGIVTLNGFVALFLGGSSTVWGGLVGGIALEALKVTVGRYLGIAFQDYVVLLVALLVFAFRPQGLIGTSSVKRA